MNSEHSLYSNAKRRSIFQSIKEKINIPQHLRERGSSFIKKEMTRLRKVDDKIRNIAAGHGSRRASFRDDITMAEDTFDQGKWLETGHHLHNFYIGLHNITEITEAYINIFDQNVTPELAKFFSSRAELKAAIIKEAGLWDAVRPFVPRSIKSLTPRGFATRQLEKLFESRIKGGRDIIIDALEDARNAYESINALFEDLDSLRASGEMIEYVELLKEFKKIYVSSHAIFLKAQDKVFKPLQNWKDGLNQDEDQSGYEPLEPAPAALSGPSAAPPSPPSSAGLPMPAESQEPTTTPQLSGPIPLGPSSSSESKDLEEERKKQEEEKKKQEEALLNKYNYYHFLKELKKVAETTNDKYLMASMIAKYSGYLEDTDPQASIKLLKIAHGIING